jgi:hypothetical protein
MANENSGGNANQGTPIKSIRLGRPVHGGGNMKTPPQKTA